MVRRADVDVRVVLREDLGDRVRPAERVVECDLAARDHRRHPARCPPRRRAVQFGYPGHGGRRVEVMTVLVDQGPLDELVLAGGNDDRRLAGSARVACRRLVAAERVDRLVGDDPDGDRADLVAVRDRAQDGGVPVGVHRRGADVEGDAPALRVRRRDDRRARAGREGECEHEDEEGEGGLHRGAAHRSTGT